MTSRRALRWVLSGLVLASLSPDRASGAEERYAIQFRSAETIAPAGSTVTLAIDMDNAPLEVTGFSLGVRHDPEFLTLEDAALGSAVRSALGGAPDDRFYQLEKNPAGGTGFTIALLFSADSATRRSVPAGTGHHLLSATYRIREGASGSTDLEITGELGSPKVRVVLDLAGVSRSQVGIPAPRTRTTVTVGQPPGADFIRGDANQNGRLDVTDATLIIDFLFGGGSLASGEATRTSCPIVMNVDGSSNDGTPGVEDERDINVTDVIALLNYQFRVLPGAPPPAAPFPECGRPAEAPAEGFACTAFSRCPD